MASARGCGPIIAVSQAEVAAGLDEALTRARVQGASNENIPARSQLRLPLRDLIGTDVEALRQFGNRCIALNGGNLALDASGRIACINLRLES